MSAFDAEVEIEGRCVTIRVSVGSLLELPQIHLQPWYALGRIPHVVEDSGFVCYLDPEGLLLDRRRPFDLIEQAIRKTVAVLSDGVAGRNRMDFVEEFDNYWSRLSGVETAHSVMNLGGGGS
ncbi:MAG TPA: E2/UBC family protein [Thermoanaerobaculia bacterium]